jgi:hypothetical protein
MNGFHPFHRFKFVTLCFGLFMLAIMAGCVNVQTTCPSCSEAKNEPSGQKDCPPDVIPIGGCNAVTFTGVPTNWWDDATGAPYTGTSPCAAGAKKCAANAGRSFNGIPCKSRVNSSTMICKCDYQP